MPVDRDEVTRRAVVPDAAGRSLWFAAVWTGVGAAVVAATLGILAVAVCWMPAAGASGHAMSTIRAGLLTFLASVHAGITIDGVPTQFVPLGMLLIVGLTAWRAGLGLADAAAELGEDDPTRLALAAGAQAASFTAACLVAVPFSTLGTSDVPFVGVAVAALLVFAGFGGTAFVRSSPLAEFVVSAVPPPTGRVVRAAIGALCVYVAAATLLVACSLVAHHARVDVLAEQVGGGWSGVPVLLLGVLAAPNAVVAAMGYLAGPGFSVGSGTTASAFGTAHGVVPAFPLLGALPTGPGATPVVWALMGVTPLVAGWAVARIVGPAGRSVDRVRECALAAGAAAVAVLVLAWQAGGGVGAGRLATVGASPWQTGLALGGGVLVGSAVTLAVQAGRIWFSGLASRRGDAPLRAPAAEEPVRLEAVEPVEATAEADADGTGKLAG